jgi:hypothetical protein
MNAAPCNMASFIFLTAILYRLALLGVIRHLDSAVEYSQVGIAKVISLPISFREIPRMRILCRHVHSLGLTQPHLIFQDESPS